MSRARIIPFLLLRQGSLVKTRKFGDPSYIGDPINAVKVFNEKEVDELVLLDIGATSDGKGPDYDLIKDIASEAFMPIGYGGGIRSLDQIERLFKVGVEKVSMNSALFENPGLIEEAARIFGSQSVVACIDVKRDLLGRYTLYSHAGKRRQKVDLHDHIARLKDMGVGELILHSMDRDGMMTGYDLAFVEKVAKSVPIPVVCVGGAGNVEHLREALSVGASAAGAGSMFVFHGRHKAVLISYTDPAEVHA